MQDYLRAAGDVLRSVPLDETRAALRLLTRVYDADGAIYIVGNGGSAATAAHFACDLAKGAAVSSRRKVRAWALPEQTAIMTAWANDDSYSRAFAAALRGLLRPDDLVVAISGSGNSPNVLAAVDYAASVGAATLGLIGFDGGKLRSRVDCAVLVDAPLIEHVEDCHLAVCHALARGLRLHVLARPSAAVRGARHEQQGSRPNEARVSLRLLGLRELIALRGLWLDPATRLYWYVGSLPWTWIRFAWLAALNSLGRQRGRQTQLLAVMVEDARVAGLFMWRRHGRVAEFGGAVHQAFRGRGIATAAWTAMLSRLFATGVRAVGGWVFSDNRTCIGVMSHLGFRPSSTHRRRRRRRQIWLEVGAAEFQAAAAARVTGQ